MSAHFPSLIVAVVGSDRKQGGLLTQLGEKLRRRGLQAHRMRTWRDTHLSDCEILLIGCQEKEANSLAQQLEHLWTRKWNHWYTAAQERRNVSDPE